MQTRGVVSFIYKTITNIKSNKHFPSLISPLIWTAFAPVHMEMNALSGLWSTSSLKIHAALQVAFIPLSIQARLQPSLLQHQNRKHKTRPPQDLLVLNFAFTTVFQITCRTGI